MPFNTLSVACAITPTVVSTFFSHYMNKADYAETPSAHLSYHEGVALVRRFLVYASHHTVEQLQSFTAGYVPHPTWVHTEDALIPLDLVDLAATYLAAQLGPEGVTAVGGENWWRWRVQPLLAEWIEMRKDYNARKAGNGNQRTMFYIHGGAYFFGSVDEHRYQLQRHARKLKGRVFAPRYRLAPQFPFPCALQDVLASYLYLLRSQDSSTIVFAGDSAGGGMALALLTLLRDQGLPMPAGAVLISPWVDLCHSFPSVVGDNGKDYIPPHGFLHKPSPAWPPQTTDDLNNLSAGRSWFSRPPEEKSAAEAKAEEVVDNPLPASAVVDPTTKPKRNTSVLINGTLVDIKEQIQMYTTNEMLAHPLVSPVNQGSLGGLPPLIILVGGGEVLRDEQIYIAHKAANPARFPPNPEYLANSERQKEALNKYPPTQVVLQVYDDCCHVTPTLSFTRHAKLMYRSIAHFSAWALSTASSTANSIPPDSENSQEQPADCTPSANVSEDDAISVISCSSSSSSASSSPEDEVKDYTTTPRMHLKCALLSSSRHKHKRHNQHPPFPTFDPETNMLRQRISHKGQVYDLPPIPPQSPSILSPAADDSPIAQPSYHPYIRPLVLPPSSIGVIKPEPVRRWMESKQLWDIRYARSKRSVQRRRLREIAATNKNAGPESAVEPERPPPSALYGRRNALQSSSRLRRTVSMGTRNTRSGGVDVPVQAKEGQETATRKRGLGWGLGFWMLMGSEHDKTTLVREEKRLAADAKSLRKPPATPTTEKRASGGAAAFAQPLSTSTHGPKIGPSSAE